MEIMYHSLGHQAIYLAERGSYRLTEGIDPDGCYFSNGDLDHSQPRVAAIKGAKMEACIGSPGFRFQNFAQRLTRRDVEFSEPAAQQRPEPAGQPLLLAEVDDMQRTVGGKC